MTSRPSSRRSLPDPACVMSSTPSPAPASSRPSPSKASITSISQATTPDLCNRPRPAEQRPSDVPVLSEDGSRIKKFVPKPRKLGTGSVDRPKPFRSPSNRSRPDSRPSRPSFNKPWEEEKQVRTDRVAAAAPQDGPSPEYQDIDLDAGVERPQPTADRPALPESRPSATRQPLAANPASLESRASATVPAAPTAQPSTAIVAFDRPAFNRDPPIRRPSRLQTATAAAPGRPAFTRDRPSFDRAPREGGSDRFQPRDARRDFTAHTASTGGEGRPPRHFGNKPGFGGKPSFGAKPSFPPASPSIPSSPPATAIAAPFRRDDHGRPIARRQPPAPPHL